jgi:hypothetical protein
VNTAADNDAVAKRFKVANAMVQLLFIADRRCRSNQCDRCTGTESLGFVEHDSGVKFNRAAKLALQLRV